MEERPPIATVYRVGIDIGGTFTDMVLTGPDGLVVTRKVSSMTDGAGRAILQGLGEMLAEAGIAGRAVGEVIHGTTVATNAILEHKGAHTGLLTTRGFRDVLELRRMRMPRMYDIGWDKPPPLVSRALRCEVDERIDRRGAIVRPLDRDGAVAALDLLLREGIRALAICLLNAYANPVHERALADLARQRAPGLHVSLSAEVSPQIKEYERTSTTVINAYIAPIVEGYLRDLTRDLHDLGVTAPLLVMQSSGGIAGAGAAARLPVRVVESGPAAGVIGAAALAARTGIRNLITFDMGGTTAKASIIEEGQIHRASEYEVGGGISLSSRLIRGEGYLLRAPVIDIAEVGAGGGSLVWRDAGGSLQVGPQSAGAVPGPVCYDAGGDRPTVTDCNLVLGYLNPEALAGGCVRLNAAKAREAVTDQVAGLFGLGLDEGAYGVHVIANASMMRAVRAVSTERGRDPRDFVLVAFGGSGPVHAVEMARALEIRTVLVPPSPGLFSAFGLLVAEVEHHAVRTYLRGTRGPDLPLLNGVLREMEAEARAALRGQGYSPEAMVIARTADLRYLGQSFELPVALPPGDLDEAGVAALEEAFATEHERTYGHRAVGEPVEWVTFHVVGRVPTERPAFRTSAMDLGRRGGPPFRRAYFGPKAGALETPVLSRGNLGEQFTPGPLIIEEYDATIVVPPGAAARCDAMGNVLIDVEREA